MIKKRDELTEDDRNFPVGLRERIGSVLDGKNYDRAVNGGSQPWDMSMPEQSSSLSYNGEVVRVALPVLDWTLRYICWPVCPSAQKLSNSMPDFIGRRINIHKLYNDSTVDWRVVLCNITTNTFQWNNWYCYEKLEMCGTNQWMLTLLATLLTTSTTTRSPSLAKTGGPGNLPFIVMMLLVWHNLVTLCNCTCKTYLWTRYIFLETTCVLWASNRGVTLKW